MFLQKLLITILIVLSNVPKSRASHIETFDDLVFEFDDESSEMGFRDFHNNNFIEKRSIDKNLNYRSSEKFEETRYYNVGVLMASHLNSPFDLERCGPAVDLALERVNEIFLKVHNIQLRKVQGR